MVSYAIFWTHNIQTHTYSPSTQTHKHSFELIYLGNRISFEAPIEQMLSTIITIVVETSQWLNT